MGVGDLGLRVAVGADLRVAVAWGSAPPLGLSPVTGMTWASPQAASSSANTHTVVIQSEVFFFILLPSM